MPQIENRPEFFFLKSYPDFIVAAAAQLSVSTDMESTEFMQWLVQTLSGVTTDDKWSSIVVMSAEERENKQEMTRWQIDL